MVRIVFYIYTSIYTTDNVYMLYTHKKASDPGAVFS